MKDSCDINNIVKRLGKHGIPVPPPQVNPSYMDLSGMPDFHTALNVVTKARQDFDALPAFVRARFMNDPTAFVEFALNKQNLPELVKMGLAKPSPLTEGEKPREMDSGASAVHSGNASQAEKQASEKGSAAAK
ncbi:scaffold protein [Microviridae sp.]|nr:scaffold protein [Microviridae sp.]